MKKNLKILTNGIIAENPVLRLVLGTCPTLAVTTAAFNGIGMGIAATFVLVCSNLLVSLLRNVIPSKVRIPAYITIIASFVTIVQLLIKAYIPSLDKSLGIFIPLIVVNCIILGRAESYASKNGVFLSVFDGIGMGLGFTLALTLLGSVRELFGSGSLFGIAVMPEAYEPIGILVMAPGAFFVLAILAALQNKFKAPSASNVKRDSNLACGGNCDGCVGMTCALNHRQIAEQTAEKARRFAEERAKLAAEKKAAKEQEGGEQG